MSSEYFDLDCTLVVENPDIDPIDDPEEPDAEYIAIINSKAKINPIPYRKTLIRGSIFAKRKDVNGEVPITFNINNIRNRYYVDSTFEYEGVYGKYDLDSSIIYGFNPHISDIDCELWFPIKLDHDICNGIVDIEKNKLSDTNPCDLDISFNIDALPIMHEVVSGVVDLMRRPYILLLFSPFAATVELLPTKYSGKETGEIDCVLETAKFKKSSDVYVRFHVHKKRSQYSLFTRFRVVPRVDKDIPIIFDVKNDQIYDIPGSVSMNKEYMKTDMDSSVEMPDYTWEQIIGTAKIEPVYTRRDIPIYFYAVEPVNSDVYIHLNVETPYTPGFVDIPVNFRIGNNLYKDILYTTFCVKAAIQTNNELPIQFSVENWRYPARVVIAVDPIWHYEAIVLKSALVTFFDRLYRKTDMTVIYGGNPRSDWDIHHLGRIFGVQEQNLINCPLIYDAHNPCNMKCSIENFIKTMTTFREGEKPYIDRVFLFLDNPIYHSSTVLGPIMDFCIENNISCVAINSHGDWQEISNPVACGTTYLRFHNTNIASSNCGCTHHHHHHFSICDDSPCDKGDIVY